MKWQRWQAVIRNVRGEVIDRRPFVWRRSAQRHADESNRAGRQAAAGIALVTGLPIDKLPADQLYYARVERNK